MVKMLFKIVAFRKIVLVFFCFFLNFNLCKTNDNCRTIYPPVSIALSCENENGNSISCSNPPSGSKMYLKCANYYEENILEKFNDIRTATCSNGEWLNLDNISCKPTCGRKRVFDPTLIIKGTDVIPGEYSWQVALYNENKLLICGGSLITEKAVITAAHCVTDDENANLLPTDNFIVAAGKYYKDYYDKRDRGKAMFSELEHIYVPEEYNGVTGHYERDLAVLIIKKAFVLSTNIQPVCLDNIDDIYDQEAFINGWGFTQPNNNAAENLKHLKILTVPRSVCKQKIPKDFEGYYTGDKICAGLVDRGMSTCKGDSGGGLVIQHNNRYHLIGVLSTGPGSETTLGCDSNWYSLYTEISRNLNFILKFESKHRLRTSLVYAPRIQSKNTNMDTIVAPQNRNTSSETNLDNCVACICHGQNGCNNNGVYGTFYITEPYWIDAGRVNKGISSGSFQDCITNYVCSKETIKKYFLNFKQDCNGDGKIDCEDVALLYKHGRTTCNQPLPQFFLEKFNSCKNV